MKRIEVDERVFQQFEEYRGKNGDTQALGRLIRLSGQAQKEKQERIALVILEDRWFDFDENPGQASNAPFLDGVCRLVDTLKSYHLNFYDANSFGHALEAAASVPEQRIILYIGAHGSKGSVGGARTSTLMKKIADFSRKRKVEGIILSSCSACGNDPAVIEALKGRSNWIFGYTSNVNFLGSVQVEAAILEQLSAAEPETVENEAELIKLFAKALACFNPKWELGSAPNATLDTAIRLVTRGKHMKTPVDHTSEVVKQAW